MAETKKMHRYFNIAQWKEEEAFLREMHQRGWKFTDLKGLGCYHFEKCEPEDVIYQLDYYSGAKKDREDYLQMFEDCGWEYLRDVFGYSYFRKAAKDMVGEEGIFSDDADKIDMIRRVIRGRMSPLLLLFFVVLIPMSIFSFQNVHYVMGVVYIALIVLYLGLFLRLFFDFRKVYQKK